MAFDTCSRLRRSTRSPAGIELHFDLPARSRTDGRPRNPPAPLMDLERTRFTVAQVGGSVRASRAMEKLSAKPITPAGAGHRRHNEKNVTLKRRSRISRNCVRRTRGWTPPHDSPAVAPATPFGYCRGEHRPLGVALSSCIRHRMVLPLRMAA